MRYRSLTLPQDKMYHPFQFLLGGFFYYSLYPSKIEGLFIFLEK